MKIASFNIKHQLFYNSRKLAMDVLDVINDNNIDVLCSQEIPRRLANRFQKVMKGYSVNGDSRYRHYLKSLPYNEKNPIITKKSVIHTKTIRYKNKIKNISEFFRYLKNVPILPRIATLIVIKTDKEKDICIINTHLDYKLSIIQKKQLKELTELVNIYKEKYEVVITGDFNMDMNDEHFVEFIEKLDQNGISKISIDEVTWRNKKGKERTLDYMFMSKTLKVLDYGIIKSNDLSDHEIIYADIDI